MLEIQLFLDFSWKCYEEYISAIAKAKVDKKAKSRFRNSSRNLQLSVQKQVCLPYPGIRTGGC